MLGGIEDPGLMLSGLVARFEEISRHENRFKSDQQMRLWRNDRKRAANNPIAALGEDLSVARIGPAEARAHRKWWLNRLSTEGLKAETANKDFTYMAGMLRRFGEDLDHVDPPRPYAGVTIRDRPRDPGYKTRHRDRQELQGKRPRLWCPSCLARCARGRACLRAAPDRTVDAAECHEGAAEAAREAEGRWRTVDHRRQHP